MVYYQEKMVDRDALCLINVMSYKLNQLRPQCYKSQILEDSTDNCIIVPTIAL